MSSSEQRTTSTGRIRPLARRLDSLSGSPTNSSSIGAPKPSLPSIITPRPSPRSSPSAVRAPVEIKTESNNAEAPPIASARDILTQARRREQETLLQKEVPPTGRESRGRKPVIHTDMGDDSSKKMVLDSYTQEDGYGDIDNSAEGSGRILASDKKRCQPLRVPFVTGDDQMVTDSTTPVVPEDDLLLFQMPSLLPTMIPVQPAAGSTSTPTKKTTRGAPARGSVAPVAKQPEVPKSVGTLFSDIPDGRIGTLRVHKSGKAVMRIGDTDFIVNEGQKTNFRTEIACVCPTESEIIFLGQATKRVVVSPVIV